MYISNDRQYLQWYIYIIYIYVYYLYLYIYVLSEPWRRHTFRHTFTLRAVSQVPVPERQWNETTRLRMEMARAKAVSWFSWLAVTGAFRCMGQWSVDWKDDLNGFFRQLKGIEATVIYVSAYIYADVSWMMSPDAAGWFLAEESIIWIHLRGSSLRVSDRFRCHMHPMRQDAPSINQVHFFCLHTFHTLAIFNYIHILDVWK